MKFHQKPITFVGQVNLKVQNLSRSLTFYQEVIGFHILEQSDRSAKLTADGKTILINLHQPDHVIPKIGRTTGLYHFALLLPKRSDLANIVHHFIKMRVPIGSADHLVSEALYLSDPDGNGIEIYTDRDPSLWQWQNGEVHMTVDPLNFQDLLSESIGKWEGLPMDTVIGHIHLHVSELQKVETFYTKGLGFKVVNRFGSQALFLSDGNYHHHIGVNTWNGVGAPAPQRNSVGLDSFTLILNEENKRKDVIAQLQNIGASVTEENGSYVTIDPSGNRIKLQL